MFHSIISFNDNKGITIDFHRLKQKNPKTVLTAIFKGFAQFEKIYITKEIKEKCAAVTIHYTEYEDTEENKTFECSFDEFMKMYNNYKLNK